MHACVHAWVGEYGVIDYGVMHAWVIMDHAWNAYMRACMGDYGVTQTALRHMYTHTLTLTLTHILTLTLTHTHTLTITLTNPCGHAQYMCCFWL